MVLSLLDVQKKLPNYTLFQILFRTKKRSNYEQILENSVGWSSLKRGVLGMLIYLLFLLFFKWYFEL